MKKERSNLFLAKKSVLFGICFVIMMLGCLVVSGTVFATPPGDGWTESFADEFNGTSLDTNEWNYRTGARIDSYNRAENVSVSGGYLNIALKAESYGGKSYTSGGVISKDTFKYGYYETRAQLTSYEGWHNSFWLCGDTSQGVTQANEIDGFEVWSHTPSTLRTCAYNYIPTLTSVGSVAYSGVNTANAYHTYGFEWTPTMIYYYVDGTLIRSAKYNKGPNYSQNMWLTGLAEDTGYGIQGDTSISFDYFKYYYKRYPDEILIDDGETGYTEGGGTFYTGGLKGIGDSDTRYCATSGAYAQWTSPTFTADTAGSYRVYIYKVYYSSSDSNAKIDVVHSGGTTTQYVNYATGSSGWVDLGSFTFNSGTTGYVRNTRNAATHLRADSVKFVKQ